MNEWLPIIGTLTGVLITGIISLALHWQSNRHIEKKQLVELSEERAKWAVEYELDRLQRFYGTAEKLIAAAESFRIQQAWEMSPNPTPGRVLSYNDARGAIESILVLARSEALLLNKDVQSKFLSALAQFNEWFLAETKQDGVEALMQFESDLGNFKEYLADYYRELFDSRRTGADV